MSTQYIDGHFGETKPFTEAMQEFMIAAEAGTAKAFHIGTPEQIEEVKSEKDNADKIEALKLKLADMEAVINKNKIIKTPTYEQVKEIELSKL